MQTERMNMQTVVFKNVGVNCHEFRNDKIATKVDQYFT